ncbi:hypothetical protein DH2020_002504 [Rehmannia glutinosa]|uniref:RWD domain-containing protein n=1 Tax=Rehmannia glutinosa TaxID=99300 RepID=A0ABR0XTW4_REHGL
MAEEEVRAEVEAVEAVYSDDCQVIEAYPPHLHVHLKPRTADVSSQQYPEAPPDISVIDLKGLDEQRQKHLLASIRGKALELASCLMLVALCEEAVEGLSSMNHPEGDCPLCLHPLLDEDASSKLEIDVLNAIQVLWKIMVSIAESNGIDIDEDLLHSESEKIRRQKFEAILKLQRENSGLIEPKKNEVLLPGMFLPQSVALPSTESGTISSESRTKDPTAKSDTNLGSSFNRPGPRKHNNSNMRKHRTQNSGKQARHWIKKDNIS